jgi:hypothetical protein
MMKSQPVLLSLLVLLFSHVLIEATPTPKIMASSKTTTACKTANTASASFGGVPSFNRCALTVRGGEVLVADTQADLDAILINANGALVVVDHWARYVSSYTVPLDISLLEVVPCYYEDVQQCNACVIILLLFPNNR